MNPADISSSPASSAPQHADSVRAGFEHAPDFMTLVDQDGKIVVANRMALAGLKLEDVVGKPFWKALWSLEKPKHQQQLRRALRDAGSGTPARFDLTLAGRDGTVRTLELSLTPIAPPANEGKPFILVEARDVTERIGREQALRTAFDELEQQMRRQTDELAEANRQLRIEVGHRRRAEEVNAKFAAIVENSNDAIIGHQLDGTIVTWNKGAERVFGYTADEVRGRSVALISPPDREDEMPRILQAIRRGELVQHFETERIRKDGRRIQVSLTVSPIRDAAGRIVGASRIARDITQRKQIEQALRDSESRARAILDTAVDGIITIDERGRIESFNRAAERLFGYLAQEVVGKNVSMLMPEPYKSEHDGYVRNYLQTGRAKIIGIGREVVGKRRDGTVFPVDLAVSEVRLGERRIFTGMVRDLSERQRLEQEILDISDREKRRIGQDLHDSLGQMLAGIGFMSKSLEKKIAARDLPEAETAHQVAELVTQAITQARALARGLQPVDPEPAGLMNALREMTINLQNLFRVTCQFDCPAPALINDSAAASHLFRIAQEAANNAIKHGQAQRIDLRLVRQDDRIILSVCDDGVGFQPATARSTGMGLHIMRYRAAMIGATLSIQPGTKGGTCVMVSAPDFSKRIDGL